MNPLCPTKQQSLMIIPRRPKNVGKNVVVYTRHPTNKNNQHEHQSQIYCIGSEEAALRHISGFFIGIFEELRFEDADFPDE